MAEDQFEHGLVGYAWNAVRNFFALQWENVWSKWFEILPKQLDSIGDRMENWFEHIDDPLWISLVAFMKDQGILRPENEKFFLQFKDYPPALSGLLGLMTWGATVNNYVNTVQAYAGTPLRHKLASQFNPELADANTLVRAAFIAPEKTKEIRETLKKIGFSDKQMDYLFLSNYTLYDPETVRQLFLRKEIDDDKVFERMREMGFTDTRIGEIMKTWEIIPGPQDLFHMVGKEAFEPDMIEKIGLGDEFPEDQVEWLEKQGISRFWAQKYWFAHWDQPSIQMGFEMFHRGVINYDDLDMLFRATEIPPFWRDKLTQIAYSPYTRVDTRRMFDEDVIGIEDVYQSYLDIGYNEEKALNLTKWTLSQKNPNDKALSTQQILGAFEARILAREDAKALLIQLGYIEARAEFIIINKEYEIEEKLQKKKLDLIKERYTLRLIDKFEAMRDLNLLNLPSKQVTVLMNEWDIELYKDRKIPSKTDLTKFLKKGIIKDDTFYSEMDKLGYNRTYAEWYFKDTMGL